MHTVSGVEKVCFETRLASVPWFVLFTFQNFIAVTRFLAYLRDHAFAFSRFASERAQPWGCSQRCLFLHQRVNLRLYGAGTNLSKATHRRSNLNIWITWTKMIPSTKTRCPGLRTQISESTTTGSREFHDTFVHCVEFEARGAARGREWPQRVNA